MPELRGLGESEKRKTLPAPLGRGHLCGLAAGWGGAAPLCGRAGLEPAFLQALGWEGLGARTQSKAGCLRISRGVWAVLDCGAAKRGSRTADRSTAFPQLRFLAEPRSPRSSQHHGKGGAGRSCAERALSIAFSLLRNQHRVPGEGCFQQPPDVGRLPACPPPGPPSARTVGLEAHDRWGISVSGLFL